MDNNKIQLFEDKRIRTAWDEEKEEWLFSIVDVVEILSGTDAPRRYWSDLKRKLKAEGSQLYEKIVQLKLKAADGKRYNTDVAKRGGGVAGIARQAVEGQTGKQVITSKSAIDFSQLISNMIEGSGDGNE